MSDIFISYAREDRDRVQLLAGALESLGWSVWWDRHIPTGKTYDQIITKAIREARCIIVVWSSYSIDSDWVREEAEIGRMRGVLIPIMIDSVSPPMGFGRIQSANLMNWEGAASNPDFEHIATDIRALLSAAGTEVNRPLARVSPADLRPESASTKVIEGSLTLKFAEIRGRGKVVRNLVTVGVLITWLEMLTFEARTYLIEAHKPD